MPGVDFEKFWRKTLNDGVVANSAYAPLSVTSKFNVANLPAQKPAAGEELEFIFRPDPSVYDGRFANNGWLQELPKPFTKLTWDNAALVSPKTAEKLALTHKVAARGGEHGQIVSTVIDIAISNSKVTAAAWILPGQADGVVVLPLGYGRKNAGYTGTNKGFNAYAVRIVERVVGGCRRQDHQENRRRVSAGLHAVSLQHGRPEDPEQRHARGIQKESRLCARRR